MPRSPIERAAIRAMMDELPTPSADGIYTMFDAAESEAWRFIARAYMTDDNDCEGR